ncbi:atp-dependent rna helicase mitochondrial-like [Nannochloropsis oceanica]
MSDPYADFGAPHDWYSQARKLKRSLILHVGPTNAGKTHEALERLQAAASGIYCGPLRLLAWEVYEKLNMNGVLCELWTGQEVKEIEGSRHVSCTVEMADITRVYDVAVVDECQLLGDKERGWAWTRAILGLPAVELHLCGSPAFVEIVHELANELGDIVEVRKYERLSPLQPQREAVGSWAEIRPGDCVVAFSRKRLFQLKNEIEVATFPRMKCCIVYGGLPPEARREQARLFNEEGSGWNVLVASDAIGMGLNLSIGRIIFSSLEKYDGKTNRQLTHAEIKQIAGRAGRFKGKYEIGTVAGREGGDVRIISRALKAEHDVIESAGLKPSKEQLLMFAKANGLKIRETEEDYAMAWEEKRQGGEGRREEERGGGTPSSYTEFTVLLKLFVHAASTLGSRAQDLYFLCDLTDMLGVARLIEEIPLNFKDRFTFCIAPVDTKQAELMSYLRFFARQYQHKKEVKLGVNVHWEKVPVTPLELKHLEEIHAVVDVYLWLGLRFGEDIFIEIEDAEEAAERCSELIEEGLKKLKPKEFMLVGEKRGGGKEGDREGGRMGSSRQRGAPSGRWRKGGEKR